MSRWSSRINRRHARRHPWLVALSIIGIATGVAVFVSIRLANVSAQRAFELSTRALTGNATHRLVGGPSGIDERLYAQLRVRGLVQRAAPVLEAEVVSTRDPQRTLRLVGVDIFAERPFRTWLGGGQLDASRFLTEPGAVLVSASLAKSRQLEPGADLPIGTSAAGGTSDLRVIGTFGSSDEESRSATEDFLVVDLATAQEVLGRTGRLDRVDLILGTLEQAERIQAALPPEVTLERASAEAESLSELTRAFELNLTALSLLALLVGKFLIYNTMTFAVVQRRRTLGTLRALGVTPGELFSLILTDALGLAIAGTALGAGAGILLARALVGLVAQTTNDLYFALEVRSVETDPATLLIGALLGICATLLSAAHPALAAAREPPVTVIRRSTQEDQTRSGLPKVTAAGVLLTLLGVGVLLWPSTSVALGFVGLFSVLIGLALTVPLLTLLLSRAARPALGAAFGSVGRIAAGGVSANLSRTSVAVAALTVSVATAVSVSTMVQSFRRTVVSWLDASLLADVYVSAPGAVGRRQHEALPRSLAAKLEQVEGAAGVFTVRTRRVRTDTGIADLVTPEFGGLPQRPYPLASGASDEVWPTFERGDGVLVSESYAFKRNLSRGDSVTVFTDKGPERFPILAVFRDYASNAGAVLLARSRYEQSFDDEQVSGIAVFAAPGVDAQVLAGRIREAMGDIPGRVRVTRTLKDASLVVFDRTFTITAVLRLLALGVSFIGVFSALLALQLERRRELALLRAIGLLPSQLWKLVSIQTALMGLMAGVLALPMGHALAAALVHVINRRSFGWTLELRADAWMLTQAVLLSTFAAVLAGLYPAWKMARTPPSLALREET